MQHPNHAEDCGPTGASASPPADFEAAGLHCIRLTARHPRAALTAVYQAVTSAGAEVRRLYLTTVADRSIADVTVAEVSAPGARRIGDAIAASVGVETVSVEHQWGRP